MDMDQAFVFYVTYVAVLVGLLILFAIIMIKRTKHKSLEVLKNFIKLTEASLEIIGPCKQSSEFRKFYSKHPTREFCFQLKSEDGKSVQIVIAEGTFKFDIPFTSLKYEMESMGWSNRRIVVFHEDFGLKVFDFFPKQNSINELV